MRRLTLSPAPVAYIIDDAATGLRAEGHAGPLTWAAISSRLRAERRAGRTICAVQYLYIGSDGPRCVDLERGTWMRWPLAAPVEA